jgi:hypothetical protein
VKAGRVVAEHARAVSEPWRHDVAVSTAILSERDGVAYHLAGSADSETRKESPMRIGTIITALLALLALVTPGPAYAGGAFALPPVACNIIIVILVIVIIYLVWSRRRP